MKIYTDIQNRIIDVSTTKDPGLTELEVPDWTFGSITENQIKCYSCILDENGNPCIRLQVSPDLFDKIGELDKQHEADQEEVTVLQMALTEQYETGLTQDAEITNTQMALTELYEGLEV